MIDLKKLIDFLPFEYLSFDSKQVPHQSIINKINTSWAERIRFFLSFFITPLQANTLSHGAGILLGVIAGYFLLVKATENAEPQWAEQHGLWI